MDNALENNNLEEGQVTDNVGQDEATQQQESGNDWESQAKYFQSEKDKLHTENQKLKQYEQVGQMLESRPDIVQAVSGMLQGGQPAPEQRIELSKDEFDPWEAYNDPSSKSYQFRQQELQDTINKAVSSQVDAQVGDVKKEVGMNKLQTELSNKGLNTEQIQSFMDFASKNPAENGIDGAINMWQSVVNPEANNTKNPLDAVRQNQSVPQQAGILTGEQPVRKDEKDNMWDTILKAGSRTNVL